MNIQCEHCGEVPLHTETCPHGCHERKPVAWKNGGYFYCWIHERTQVMSAETIYKGDVVLTNRKCDWCGAKL
jgi:hypothetical protein